MYQSILTLCAIIITAVTLHPALPAIDSAPDAGKFTFAVVGDLHGRDEPGVPPEFATIIKELNLLRPDFIVSTGDIIEDQPDDAALIKAAWDEWRDVVDTNLDGIPFFPIAGNNDIWSTLSAKFYQDNIAPMWYSFDYGACHFVVMCSEEPGHVSEVGPSQKTWLEADLKANSDAEHTFCFMHRPMWYKFDEPGWEDWYDDIHPLLSKYGVDYFFSGHWHVYENYGEVDGIDYIISGGAGGTLDTRRPAHLGPFYHYLLVTVDGEDVDIAVVKAGSVVPDDIVTTEMVRAHNDAMRIFSRQPVFEVEESLASYKGMAYFNLANPFDAAIAGTINWIIPGKGWIVRCPSDFSMPPNGSLPIPITVSYSGNDPIFTEWPEYTAVYDVPTLAGSPFTAKGKLRVVPIYDMMRTMMPIVIDGDLSDWENIEPVKVADGRHMGGFEEWRGEELSLEFRLAWDADNLYLACEVTDDAHYQPYNADAAEVWMGDSVMFGVDSRNADRVDYSDDDFEIVLSLHDGKAGIQPRYASDGSMIQKGEGMKVAIKREWEFTRYEFAIKRTSLPYDFLKPGAKIGFSILASDNDGDDWEGFMEWSPGSLTYGKDLASFGTVRLLP